MVGPVPRGGSGANTRYQFNQNLTSLRLYWAETVQKIKIRIPGRDFGRSTVSRMDLSLIICTWDRCNQLARCLEAVRRIRCERPWELIGHPALSRDGYTVRPPL